MNFSGSQPSTAAVSLPSGVAENQLERILASTHFADAPRLKRFLTFVVMESLAGNGDRLKGYTLGLEVFDRPDDFDPQTDTIVRVQAGQLRKRLDLYYADEGRDDPLRIYVPKGCYAPQFQVQFERNATAPADNASQAAQPPHTRGPAIAVLPLQDYSGEGVENYFANGLTEEIIADLARFKDLFVFSRSTTARLARDGTDIRQLHEEIGADYVVEGSVRRSKDTVRVTVQLIDAANEGHIFAEQFERPSTLDGVFEIQDEIARLVAGRIADRYGPLGRHAARAHRGGQSQHWETYDWITRYYDYYATHDPERHAQVRDGLQAALERDAKSSDGWAALALLLIDEYRLHINERPTFPALERALEFAERAVTHGPDNAFAYQALCVAHFHAKNFNQSRAAGERAVQLNPGNGSVLADVGFCNAALGNWDSGLALLDRAIELSPVHPGWYHLARACRNLIDGEPRAGIVELREAPMPGFYWFHALLACLHAEAGEVEKAKRELVELDEVYPDFAANARRETEIWSMHATLAETLLAGWRKAGLAIK